MNRSLGFVSTTPRVLVHGLAGCAFYGAYAAKMLGLAPATVYKLSCMKVLTGVKLGGRRLFRPEELERFVVERDGQPLLGKGTPRCSPPTRPATFCRTLTRGSLS